MKLLVLFFSLILLNVAWAIPPKMLCQIYHSTGDARYEQAKLMVIEDLKNTIKVDIYDSKNLQLAKLELDFLLEGEYKSQDDTILLWFTDNDGQVMLEIIRDEYDLTLKGSCFSVFK